MVSRVYGVAGVGPKVIPTCALRSCSSSISSQTMSILDILDSYPSKQRAINIFREHVMSASITGGLNTFSSTLASNIMI